MNETSDNIVLEHLRHIRAKVDKTDKAIDDLKIRMSLLETAMLAVKREPTGLKLTYVNTSRTTE